MCDLVSSEIWIKIKFILKQSTNEFFVEKICIKVKWNEDFFNLKRILQKFSIKFFNDHVI